MKHATLIKISDARLVTVGKDLITRSQKLLKETEPLIDSAALEGSLSSKDAHPVRRIGIGETDLLLTYPWVARLTDQVADLRH